MVCSLPLFSRVFEDRMGFDLRADLTAFLEAFASTDCTCILFVFTEIYVVSYMGIFKEQFEKTCSWKHINKC